METNTAPIVVLVVEDEKMIMELIEPALEEGGFSVKVAFSARDALRILEDANATPVRALVTDIDLKSTASGWDLGRRTRELLPDLPVVYMTGGHADEWSAQGVPNSILITKPFAPAQIVTAVSQLLNTTPPSSM